MSAQRLSPGSRGRAGAPSIDRLALASWRAEPAGRGGGGEQPGGSFGAAHPADWCKPGRHLSRHFEVLLRLARAGPAPQEERRGAARGLSEAALCHIYDQRDSHGRGLWPLLPLSIIPKRPACYISPARAARPDQGRRPGAHLSSGSSEAPFELAGSSQLAEASKLYSSQLY